jgi:hypothetical protein
MTVDYLSLNRAMTLYSIFNQCASHSIKAWEELHPYDQAGWCAVAKYMEHNDPKIQKLEEINDALRGKLWMILEVAADEFGIDLDQDDDFDLASEPDL